MRQIKDLMTSPVHVIDPNTSLAAAARRMRDENVGSLPVGEGEELLGMITDRDIVVRCVADGVDCNNHSVRDAMSAGKHTMPIDQAESRGNPGVRPPSTESTAIRGSHGEGRGNPDVHPQPPAATGGTPAQRWHRARHIA